MAGGEYTACSLFYSRDFTSTKRRLTAYGKSDIQPERNSPCIFNDDFNELASLMAESDVIVFCTPLYWYSFPAQIKAAIDKFYSFIIGKKDVPIKECMLLSCGELEDPHVFDGIVRSFELIAQDRGWKNRGHYLVNSVNEKGAISNTEHLQKIYDIGKRF